MEEENVDDSRSEAGKTDSIGHNKEGTKIEIALILIRLKVNMKVRVNNARNIVLLATVSEEAIWEYGEVLCFVDIEPVCEGGKDICDHNKSYSNIDSSKPWAGKRTPNVRGYAGPIKSNGTNSKTMESWT